MRLAHCGRTIGSARMDGRMERRRSSDAAPVHKIGGGFFFFEKVRITPRTIAVVRITSRTIKSDILHPQLFKPDELPPLT